MACFYDSGLQFSCTRCSACCRFSPGYVFLSRNDVSCAAAHLNIKEKDFLLKYCRKVDIGSKIRISLLEKSNFDCIFWDENREGCTVYPARPLQCRSYPFWPQLLNEKNWQEERRHCPGIGIGKIYTKEDIDKIQELRQADPLISLEHTQQDWEIYE